MQMEDCKRGADMGIANCSECGKLFMKTSSSLCPNCLMKEEEYESIVAEYVRDHPRVSAREVCQATGIKERIITRMLKSGRLVGTDISYPCQKCGEMIFTGTYCEKCSEDLQGQLNQARQTIQSTASAHRGVGMYSKKPLK